MAGRISRQRRRQRRTIARRQAQRLVWHRAGPGPGTPGALYRFGYGGR